MWMQPDGMAETFVLTGYDCPRCHGSGEQWDVSPADGQPRIASCPMCGGSGRLDAEVTVQWRPATRGVEKRNYKRET